MIKNITSYLNEKEEKAMTILWESDSCLPASQIASKINEDWAYKSIQNVIKNLDKKNFIEIGKIDKSGKSYARYFKPKISKSEYALIMFKKFYDGSKNVSDTLCELINLLESQKDNINLKRDFRLLTEKYAKK